MTSLIEDCQAWIDKGQESWKSYFSKWETFAEYEESLPESELIHKLSDKPRKRKNGNQKPSKLRLAQKGLKRVFLKNQHRKQKKLIKKKKSCQKDEEETRSCGNENLVEILENKQQLEISLMTVFSDLLKANTNKYELFAVLFQTFTDREMTVKDSDLVSSGQQQMLLNSDFERRVANFSIQRRVENQRVLSGCMPGNNLVLENQRILSVCMPGNNLALETPRVLSLPKLRNNLNDRSICPPRNVYLQSLNENEQESNSEQMQGNFRQGQNSRVGAKDANNISRSNLSEQRSLTLDDGQAPILEKSNLPYKPDLFRIRNTKSVEFDANHQFPKSFYQNKECIRSTTISESSIQEGRRLGNFSLQLKTNRMSLSMDNANFITAQKKLSEHKHLGKLPSQKRQTSKKLISDYNESDSDSDDQTKYHSPLIHCQNKRLKAGEQVEDDCQHIFDRVLKS